jgi:hydroxymethylglutaryl-CoA synthase
MVGIKAFGAYIPVFRVARGPNAGEKAVANMDEDSVTMAVAAGIDCLGKLDRKTVDALYFASTTSPYKEKMAATTVAMALDLKPGVPVVDIGDSLRAGTIALGQAVDAVKAGTYKNVLVTIADCRVGTPGSEIDMMGGDAAAAFLVSDSDVAAEAVGRFELSDDFIDYWRRDGERVTDGWEDRFMTERGYSAHMNNLAKGAFGKLGIKPDELGKVAVYGAEPRSYMGFMQRLGVTDPSKVQDPLFMTVGNAGAANIPLQLVAILEGAKAGDKVLTLNYGDGGDAYLWQVTGAIDKVRDGSRRLFSKWLASKLPMRMDIYMRLRPMRGAAPGSRSTPGGYTGSLNAFWRAQSEVLRLHAGKCRTCGLTIFPIQRVCLHCQTKDNNDEVRIAEEKGKLTVFTKDFSFGPDPNVVSVVDLDNGVRYHAFMTDRDHNEVKADMPIELTFRKVNEGAGFHNYHWKIRPIR